MGGVPPPPLPPPSPPLLFLSFVPPFVLPLTCINTSGPYTCGDSTSLLFTGSLTGASTAEHRPPPQKHGSEHCVGAALPLVPSQKTSSVGSTESTAAPSLSAPSLQSVSGHPVPHEALPCGSLLRSTAKTFQNSPERPAPPRPLALYLAQSVLRQEITLSSPHPASSSCQSSVMPRAAAWWWRSRRTRIPRFAASLTQWSSCWPAVVPSSSGFWEKSMFVGLMVSRPSTSSPETGILSALKPLSATKSSREEKGLHQRPWRVMSVV